ncbi:hypothetical protein MHYP_G00040590 [Metynnis hypsauchen]
MNVFGTLNFGTNYDESAAPLVALFNGRWTFSHQLTCVVQVQEVIISCISHRPALHAQLARTAACLGHCFCKRSAPS